MYMENQQNSSDVFGRAAHAGPVAGVYFTALFLSAAYAGMYPMLSLVTIVMFLGVPWLLYVRLAGSVHGSRVIRTVSLWTEGIYTFLFGGLIMALLVYLWLRYADPEYLHNQLELASRLLREHPEAAAPELRGTIEAALQEGALPGPIQMAMSLFWSVTFTGAMLSLLVSFIIVKIKSSKWTRKS